LKKEKEKHENEVS
jgi:hypothetical protein